MKMPLIAQVIYRTYGAAACCVYFALLIVLLVILFPFFVLDYLFAPEPKQRRFAEVEAVSTARG